LLILEEQSTININFFFPFISLSIFFFPIYLLFFEIHIIYFLSIFGFLSKATAKQPLQRLFFKQEKQANSNSK